MDKENTSVKSYNHFIDGEYVEPLGGKWLDSMDPYRGEPWARVPQGCARDVGRAVAAASRAMKSGPWATMTATNRGKLMLRLADLVTQNADRLAEIEVRDNGKLLAEMRGQMGYHPEWCKILPCSTASTKAMLVQPAASMSANNNNHGRRANSGSAR